MTKKTVFCVGDMHAPWASKRTLLEIYKAIRKVRPDVVIQIGDLYDMFSFSRFPRTHNLYTPEQELTIGRKDTEIFWRTIRSIVPKARCIQLLGNHEQRVVKRVLQSAPELESFLARGIHSLLQYDGVELIKDASEIIMIDGIGYHHGYLARLGDHAKSFLTSMVVGHTHRGGVAAIKLETGIIWELNVGFVANRHALPMSYSAQRRFSNWTLGYGIVDEFGPRFVPLNTEEAR